MERYAFALKIREGCFQAFRQTVGEVWKELTALLDELEVHNFSLWNIEELVFGYYETGCVAPDESEAAAAALLENQQQKALTLTDAQRASYNAIVRGLEAVAEWISPPDAQMRLMYHDFGIVRENKELIRHRVFATRLKGDYQEEYKRRHDALVEARGGKVTPGPDSNFSIWNAERYIFGYDEIDVTMEEAETEESRQGTIDWEVKMLEIMEWYTDDVDWISGAHHKHIQCIGHHN